METTILLDRHLEGYDEFLQVGLREIGWDDLLTIKYAWLRDFGLPDNYPDQDIWRFVQQRGFLLVTSNRNNKDETSLTATIQRENTPDSLPVVTIPQAGRLAEPDYRQRVVEKLVEIIITSENYRGTGRIFIS